MRAGWSWRVGNEVLKVSLWFLNYGLGGIHPIFFRKAVHTPHHECGLILNTGQHIIRKWWLIRDKNEILNKNVDGCNSRVLVLCSWRWCACLWLYERCCRMEQPRNVRSHCFFIFYFFLWQRLLDLHLCTRDAVHCGGMICTDFQREPLVNKLHSVHSWMLHFSLMSEQFYGVESKWLWCEQWKRFRQ